VVVRIPENRVLSRRKMNETVPNPDAAKDNKRRRQNDGLSRDSHDR